MASKRPSCSGDQSSKIGGQRRKVIRTSISATGITNPDPASGSEDERSTEKATDICGMINCITLKNILCHDYLNVDVFTPGINLLQGKNGSGKSSIVAAVIAGLGGNLRSTDRGTSVKSLIKNGKSTASIEIHLKNSGSLAYQHDVYGDELIVERKIPANGSATYKIKACNGKVISTKKEDLTRILDWYNFQVDNPLLILSQERAKSFLSSTDPRELFKFYMSATFLQQLKDGLGSLLANLESLANLIRNKTESLSVLESDVKEWEQKVQTVNTLQEKRKKVTFFRHEKAWAEIRDYELDLEQKKKDAGKEEFTLNQIQSNLRDYNAKKKHSEATRKKLDEALIDLASKSEENDKIRKKSTEELAIIKQKLRTETTKKMILDREILDRDKDITILRTRLEKDDDEAKNAWAITSARIKAEKQSLETELAKLKDFDTTEDVHRIHLQEQLTIEQNEFNQFELEERAILSRLHSIQRELKSLMSDSNGIAKFGPNMPGILDEIEQAHSRNVFTAKPVGPLGKHIKIKDPQWAHIAELVLGNLMTAFQVTNSKDLHTLQNIFRRILSENERRKITIFVSSFRDRVHDCRRKETGTEHYHSLWSYLEVDNIQVANTIIDQLNCESTLLISTGQEAAKLLKDQRSVPANCKRAYTLRGDNYYPDPNYKVYSGTGDRQVRYLHDSVEDRVRDLNINIRSTTNALEETKKEKLCSGENLRSLKVEISKSDKKKIEYKMKIQNIYKKLQDLANQETPPPPDVIQLQNELEEHELRKVEAQEKVTKINLAIEQINCDLRNKQSLQKATMKDMDDIQGQASQHTEHLDEVNNQLMDVKNEILTKTKKLELLKQRMTGTQTAIEELEKQLQRKVSVMSSIHPERIETAKSVEDINKALTALEHVLRKAEDTHGDPITVITTLKEKVKRFEEINGEIKSQRELISSLKNSVTSRSKLFKFNKRLSSLVLSSSFKAHVEKRNLVGEINVDYDKENIEILMKKMTGKENKGKLGEGLQSLKMMSGGERSFATVSYIVSLWELVHSPVRIMDEFDIFMDVVSKKQCINMIVNSVTKNSQYILVSPQEYSGKSTDQLTVFRMPDPERSGIRRPEEDEDN